MFLCEKKCSWWALVTDTSIRHLPWNPIYTTTRLGCIWSFYFLENLLFWWKHRKLVNFSHLHHNYVHILSSWRWGILHSLWQSIPIQNTFCEDKTLVMLRHRDQSSLRFERLLFDRHLQPEQSCANHVWLEHTTPCPCPWSCTCTCSQTKLVQVAQMCQHWMTCWLPLGLPLGMPSWKGKCPWSQTSPTMPQGPTLCASLLVATCMAGN